MTNKELQEELKKYPNDMIVNLNIDFDMGDHTRVHIADLKYVKKLDGEIYLEGDL